ncbi:putative 11.9 kDa salivary protein [Anopheles sinensis]|uniref:Putative 11.9 kDa salivary protein n=1 Tax=Anopheles sinensis TaxID=74873 RepID=A0A084VK20_ANOSI|nr:putative 11.9 kDa salivary protein [Anopheles sinensis]
MNHNIRCRPGAQLVPLISLLLLGQLLGEALGQSANGRDFVFPPVNDLAIGDRCTVPPSPASSVSFAREGICRRVRDCPTFVPRVILESFDIRRDVCFFEVHDPVVCCVRDPVPSRDLQRKIARGQQDVFAEQPTEYELDYSNMIN